MKRWVIPFILMFLLTSCRLPSLLPQTPGAGGPALQAPSHHGMVLRGRIENPRSVAALFEDIAKGATIALIDSESGYTLGTSVTTPTGEFVMTFGDDFTPVDGRAYYLDVLKGIQTDPGNPASPYNQAGADVLRLRNLLFYQAATDTLPAGWQSLMNATASNNILIGNRSTTLSIAIALKVQAGETVVMRDYIGALEPDPYVAVGGVSADSFNALYLVVKEAIAENRDPLSYAVYDENQGSFVTSWVGFSVAKVTPTTGGIGTTLTIEGEGFNLGAPTVAINGVQAEVVGVTDTTITAIVNPGTRTGPVSVKIGTTTLAGSTFTVNFNDGHSALLNGKLYVANPDWDTISEVASDGSVKTIWTAAAIPTLDAPVQIAAWNNKLYVSCQGASNKVIVLDPANTAWSETFAAVTKPYGLAFDSGGNLYVASYQSAPSGAILKFNAAKALLAQYDNFDQPVGLAFDYRGVLYASEYTGRVVKMTPPAMTPETWQNLPRPMGLAVDSAGDLYVASNTANVIYRLTRLRQMSVFAMTNAPRGLTLDERGYLYVSDSSKNLISRISPTGDAKVYAYGISDPRGLAIDPVTKNVFVSLGQSNAILKVENGALKPFVTGIANPQTLKFRGTGMLIAHPETHTIAFADRSGKLRTLATGLEYPGGADQSVDGGNNLTGPLFVGRFGDIVSPVTARLPKYGSYANTNGDYNGVDVVDGLTKTLRRPLYRQQLSYIAADNSKNIYAIHSGDRSLVKISAQTNPGASNYSRAIRQLAGPRAPYQFEENPSWVSVDRDENVYVVVPAANKIYRFVKAANYAKEEITGFNSPWGITFSDTTPQAMYVSNTGDGIIRRVLNPATDAAAQPTGTFGLQVDMTVKGMAYMPSEVVGTGTLYLANNSKIQQVSIAANNVSSGVSIYFEDPDDNWPYLFAHTVNKTLYAYRSYTFGHLISPGTPPLLTNFVNQTGWSRFRGFTMSADNTRYDFVNNYGGLSTMNAMNTTREIELDGNYLYVASPDDHSGGGILRINLTNDEELYIPLQTYSLAKYGADLYAGASNNRIYRVDGDGKYYETWNIGTLPLGLDVDADTGKIWAIGSDARIIEATIGGGFTSYYYGLRGPSF